MFSLNKIWVFFVLLFMIPFLIFLGLEFGILKNDVLYPIFYQLSATITLVLSFYYFIRIEKKWKGWIGWFFVVLSLIFLFIGDTIWNFYAIFLREEAPFPGISDIFYVMFYVFSAIFLIYFIKTLKIELSASESFMVSIISLVFFILLLYNIILPVYVSKEMTSLMKLLNILYILGDFGLIILAFILVVGLWGGKIARNYFYFIIGLSLATISDIVFVYIFKDYGISNWIDVFYLASFILISFSIVNESLLHISTK